MVVMTVNEWLELGRQQVKIAEAQQNYVLANILKVFIQIIEEEYN